MFYTTGMSQYIHKRHNVSVLMYHIVCPCKYRRAVVTDEVASILRSVCVDISNRYEIEFIQIGSDMDHVHFLVQSVPVLSPSVIVQTIKSVTAREIRSRAPSVKKQLWGAAFWTSGYFVNTVSRNGSESSVRRYVANQGRTSEYQVLHTQQLKLF
jgi:REP element-mobilizing transposase RayT